MSWYGGYASGRGPGEPTYSVGELTKEVKEVVGGSFRDFWVQGEIQRIHSSARGHLYFELVEKGVGDRIVGKLDAVVWRSEHERLRRLLSSEGHRLAAGQVVRCFGGLDFYPAGGRLQMIVRDLDPAFTLGDLERRRRATLGALEQAGLLDANAELDLPSVPLRLGLITSDGSAAQQDVLAGLRESGLGFRLLFVHTSVQGAGAEREIAEAIELLGRAALDGRPLDALLLVRGGGARTDLAAFDSRAVAFAVARCPRPVICGLGHQSDQTVADRVCHTSVKTPTKAAELMREVVDAAEQRLVAVRGGLIAASQRRLLRALQVLGRGERLARLARTRLESRRRAVDEAARRLELVARRRLERLAPRLAALEKSLGEGAQRSLARRRQLPEGAARRLARVGALRLEMRSAQVEALARLCHELAPERLLERGYSITRRSDGGALTAPDQVRSGDAIVSHLRDGVLVSRVEVGEAESAAAEPRIDRSPGERDS